jgi:signal transduction histidine kinase
LGIDLNRRDLTDIDQWAGLGRLASSLAHEVINPLSAVLNLSMVLRQLMEEANPPAGRRGEIGKYLDDMIRELMRVSRALSEVAAYSQLSRTGTEASDLNRMSENALALVSHRAKLENLEFE